jgi:FkbM family methyltransferase
LGVSAKFKYFLHRRNFGSWSDGWIQPKGVAFPLLVRRGSSDIDVFNQIFVQQEYACLDDLSNVGLVVDCGANVGYSSAYFLSKFPQCSVIAVEPDSRNFSALQRNLVSYGTRAKLINAGIWSQTAQLVISQDKYRDGREWTRQVRECEESEEADIQGIDIGSILKEAGSERISLLKMDVEGAEAVVFSKNYDSWLHRVDAIAIELHDDSVFGNASAVFSSAINGQEFEVSRSGELTICRRPVSGNACG